MGKKKQTRRVQPFEKFLANAENYLHQYLPGTKDGKLYSVLDNTIWAQETFFIRSVLRKIWHMASENQIDGKSVANVMSALKKYLTGEILMFWDESGNLQMEAKKDDRKEESNEKKEED